MFLRHGQNKRVDMSEGYSTALVEKKITEAIYILEKGSETDKAFGRMFLELLELWKGKKA